jgi:hypothetical protein
VSASSFYPFLAAGPVSRGVIAGAAARDTSTDYARCGLGGRRAAGGGRGAREAPGDAGRRTGAEGPARRTREQGGGGSLRFAMCIPGPRGTRSRRGGLTPDEYLPLE